MYSIFYFLIFSIIHFIVLNILTKNGKRLLVSTRSRTERKGMILEEGENTVKDYKITKNEVCIYLKGQFLCKRSREKEA